MPEYVFRYADSYLDVANSKDSYIIAKNGRKYLDFLMGWCVGNAGWNKKAITDSMKKFKGPTYVSPTYNYDGWERLGEKLVSITGLDATCFRATGGTEAVEIALKISKAYNRRKNFIAFKNAYHGQSFACMALVGLHENKFGPYPDNYLRINPLSIANWDKLTESVVNNIKKKNICAFISEPIICNLGVVVPPKSFFQSVREACDKTDTVMILDEVTNGFGRTGEWFGFQNYGIKPDIITIAKGFSSGYAPIGATVADAKIAESMRFDFSNYSTFGWQPLAVETAIANINYIEKNKLVERAKKSGEYLMSRLTEFSKPSGKGLCIGMWVKNTNVKKKCRDEGLLLDAFLFRAVLFPALDVTKQEMDTAVEIIRKNSKF
ncbi:MAG: aspartate aminotransferase family protein [Candidatus Aenigmarchaeota archaeon]|nr:aspartate aminotransferase family protein [Candidatus Aenigmarchaeota archaeon]